MKRAVGIARVVFVIAGAFNHHAFAQYSVATPALDTSIFRDGEVEDKIFNNGEWHAKCQQIVKIRRRICNLLSKVIDSKRNVVGSAIIATTDAGIPAMMISLPPESSPKKEIYVFGSHLSAIDGKAVKVEFSQSVNAMICDSTCKYMFPLDPKLVFILNGGEDVQIALKPPGSVPKSTKKKAAEAIEANAMTIPGQGFAEILTKSTAPW